MWTLGSGHCKMASNAEHVDGAYGDAPPPLSSTPMAESTQAHGTKSLLSTVHGHLSMMQDNGNIAGGPNCIRSECGKTLIQSKVNLSVNASQIFDSFDIEFDYSPRSLSWSSFSDGHSSIGADCGGHRKVIPNHTDSDVLEKECLLEKDVQVITGDEVEAPEEVSSPHEAASPQIPPARCECSYGRDTGSCTSKDTSLGSSTSYESSCDSYGSDSVTAGEADDGGSGGDEAVDPSDAESDYSSDGEESYETDEESESETESRYVEAANSSGEANAGASPGSNAASDVVGNNGGTLERSPDSPSVTGSDGDGGSDDEEEYDSTDFEGYLRESSDDEQVSLSVDGVSFTEEVLSLIDSHVSHVDSLVNTPRHNNMAGPCSSNRSMETETMDDSVHHELNPLTDGFHGSCVHSTPNAAGSVSINQPVLTKTILCGEPASKGVLRDLLHMASPRRVSHLLANMSWQSLDSCEIDQFTPEEHSPLVSELTVSCSKARSPAPQTHTPHGLKHLPSLEEGANHPCEDTESSHHEVSEMEIMEMKMQAKRKRILEEILASEGTYQRHLELVVKFFEEPLLEHGILPSDAVITIFSNIRQLASINKELLLRLEQQEVGQAFLLMGPFLKLYSTYANNHERALAAMIDWDQKSEEFANFRRQQELLEEMKGLKLNALLITPVQRIPRYKLLLEDLLRNTPSSHPDYTALSEAVDQISGVAMHINEHIKQQDNFQRMLSIQRCLSGPTAPMIITPGRMFIKDGLLKKVPKAGGRSRERRFFLFSDMLLYAKPRLLEGAQSYTVCCIMPLHHCQVTRLLGHGHGQGTLFSIMCKDESILLHSDQSTADSWISALEKAIRDVGQKRSSLRKNSSTSEPMKRGAIVKFRRGHVSREATPTASPGSPAVKPSPDRFSFPSPSQSLKRALRETDINCLSPKRSMKDARLEDEAIGHIERKLPSRMSKYFNRKSFRRKRDPSKYWKPRERVERQPRPGTPDELDALSLQDNDIVDLDQSSVWHNPDDNSICQTPAPPNRKSSQEGSLSATGFNKALEATSGVAQQMIPIQTGVQNSLCVLQ